MLYKTHQVESFQPSPLTQRLNCGRSQRGKLPSQNPRRRLLKSCLRASQVLFKFPLGSKVPNLVLETAKLEQKYILFRAFIKFVLFSFPVTAFGLGVYIVWQKIPITDTLSSTLCEFDRDFGLYGVPFAMCSNL
jgi:hypothetical protein